MTLRNLSLFILFVIIRCNIAFAEDIKDLTPSELLILAKDISIAPDPSYHLGPSDVQFYALSRETLEPVLLTSESNYVLNNSKESKILIHGWLENHKRSWYKAMAEEFLKHNDCYIIQVDWEQPARLPYLHSSKITNDVGNLVGEFIAKNNISPKNVHLIGHSLGSHVAGFAGKKVLQDTGMKVGRISGLDPAGPAFRHPSVTGKNRLDKDDAEIVDVLHTDAGFYGYEDPIGTLDIYINGGRRIQPGCMEWPSLSSLGSIHFVAMLDQLSTSQNGSARANLSVHSANQSWESLYMMVNVLLVNEMKF